MQVQVVVMLVYHDHVSTWLEGLATLARQLAHTNESQKCSNSFVTIFMTGSLGVEMPTVGNMEGSSRLRAAAHAADPAWLLPCAAGTCGRFEEQGY